MIIEETKLKGCFILQPQVYQDSRGYFFESFNQETFKSKLGFSPNFVQDNESKSSKGVLRGLHYQLGVYAQSKLIRVVNGSILDVVVDVRKDSKTYGECFSIEISSTNKKQLYIPKGFAHGFLVLEDDTVINYKCDNFYNKAYEAGIIYNDADLAIDWNFPMNSLILSDKDKALPEFKNIRL
ncbi:MAG: dTDP-4-dehydrorhamnose 3,5-epimerase [Flavobacteriaceae bacterium]